MNPQTWRMAVIVTFGVVLAVTLVLATGGIWDTSGDQATKGLARFYGILMLLFLAAGLLVFLLTKASALRVENPSLSSTWYCPSTVGPGMTIHQANAVMALV